MTAVERAEGLLARDAGGMVVARVREPPGLAVLVGPGRRAVEWSGHRPMLAALCGPRRRRENAPVEPETRYARSGEVNIAYQVTGDGPFDVVYVTPMVSHVELAWTVPAIAAYFRSLASFCRLIRFDKRGTGMSDRVSGVPSLETRMDDVRAVMDAAGSECAALIGQSEGGPMCILFAATYPRRTWALVLEGSFARTRWAHDYPWGRRDEEQARVVARRSGCGGRPSTWSSTSAVPRRARTRRTGAP